MASITLNNLAHSYHPDPKGPEDFALKSIDHVWEDGGAYALLGPSGCGKTTLLNIISGLLVPSRGQILFNDRDVTRLPPEQRDIAQVFQFPVIYDTMTVRENLAFPLVNRGLAKNEIAARVHKMLDILELQGKADRKARNLTADDKQKISLGRGLVRYDVNAILFDEPLTVIDPHLKWQLRSKLRELHSQFGHTMIYVTHDQTEALTFANKVVVMYEGEVVQIGTPEELFEKPAHTFVGYFIGSPGMNILPTTIEGNRARLGQHETILAQQYPALSGKVELGIRPEYIRVVERGQGLPVQIREVEDIGRFRIVRGTLQGDESGAIINSLVPEDQSLPADADFLFNPDKVGVYLNNHIVRSQGS
ncbi:MAG: ABC transporter ATP-binding protein [unclassified Hahellaceae]|nr:ABC transporter ATP-binding protein [Hahellaceae bacterium]|tara:strand:- start:55230 stop:56318 length:1089 start_codon:yes stop_codon:yes gene_type:complete